MAFAKGTHNHNFVNNRLEGTELPKSWLAIKDQVEWQTANFEPGDLVIFDSSVVHGSFM